MNKKIKFFTILKTVAVLCIVLLTASFAEQFDIPEPKVVDGKLTEISYSNIKLIDKEGVEQSFTISERTRISIFIPTGSEKLKQNLYLNISGKGNEKSINAEMISLMSELTSEIVEEMTYKMGVEAFNKLAGGKVCKVKSVNPLVVEDFNSKEFSIKVSSKTKIYEVSSGKISDVKKDDSVSLRIFDFSDMGYSTFIIVSVYKEK